MKISIEKKLRYSSADRIFLSRAQLAIKNVFHCKPDARSWAITLFDVDFDEKIGSGGL
jgi:hypothetical protein